eukprot:2414119-Lingulodinium_polyedra.AAC.1
MGGGWDWWNCWECSWGEWGWWGCAVQEWHNANHRSSGNTIDNTTQIIEATSVDSEPLVLVML